jgi:hypothetical protein
MIVKGSLKQESGELERAVLTKEDMNYKEEIKAYIPRYEPKACAQAFQELCQLRAEHALSPEA